MLSGHGCRGADTAILLGLESLTVEIVGLHCSILAAAEAIGPVDSGRSSEVGSLRVGFIETRLRFYKRWEES